MSLNTETLGLGRGDIPANVLAPPPLFPPLVNRPVQINKGLREKRLLEIQSSMMKQFKSSQPSQYQRIDWNYLPKELKIGVQKRTKSVKPNLTDRKSKIGNIEDRLKNLEEKEKKDDSDEDEEIDKKGGNDSEDEEKKEADEELEEEADEEMDDGTDYANNFFDNGEGYEDEDDNLDEGGIY